MVKDKITRSLIDTGYPSAKVDEVFKDITDLPQSLVDSYLKMCRENFKEILENNDDYQDIKTKGGKQYPHLDKL